MSNMIVKVYGYAGLKVVSKDFFAKDEQDFCDQVDKWKDENGITEWSRASTEHLRARR